MRNVIQKGFLGQAAIAACTLFACTLLSTTAQAQSSTNSASALTQRIDRLERELQTLNRSVYKDGAQIAPAAPAASANAYADLASRISTLEDQIRNLTGQNEELGNRIDQQKQQIDRQLTDFEIRFKELEAKSGTPATGAVTDTSASITPPQPTPPVATPASATTDAPAAEPTNLPTVQNGAAPQDSPTQKTLGQVTSTGAAAPDAAVAYENAYSFIKSGNNERARAEFTSFLKAYPEHPLASNASYWLAETYFATDDFPTAARMFAESYQKYPKGPKAADSILKLSLSLAGTGKNAEACIALKQLKKDFATGDQAVLSRADEEIKRLACS